LHKVKSMVQNMLKVITAGVFLLGCLITLRAEVFLVADYNLSARSAGLRNCDAAVSATAASVYANPALISDVKDISGGTSLNRGFGGQNLTSLYGVYPLEDYTVGGGLAYLGYGDFTSYRDQSLTDKTEFSAYDLLLTGSVSRKIHENLTAGANLKLYNSKIENYSSTAVGVDLTVAYKMLDETMTLGGGLYNAGYQLDAYNETRENLPLSVKAGLANRFKKLPLELSVQYNYSIYGQSGYAAGLEFRPKPNLNLRAGYDFTADDKKIGTASQKEKFAGLAMGGTVIFKYFSIDLAYQINGELEENWTFGINSQLFEKTAEPVIKPE